MSDKDLEKKLGEYQQLAKENPNVDVNLLMMNALQNANKDGANKKSYRWPYLIAISLPPLGLLFAIKYYFFSDDENDKTAGNVCVILTIVSIALIVILGKVFFSTAGVSPQQIEQIKPQQVQQELQ